VAVQNQLRSPTSGRLGGSLFESASGFMQGLKPVKRGATGPTSPAGAAAAGATEDQAKMVGAGAQKQASLASSMREVSASTGPQQKTEAETSAEQIAGSLQGLGQIGSRVTQLINNRITTAAQATAGLSVNEEELGRLFSTEATPEARTTRVGDAKKALETYLSSPSQATLDAFLEVAGLSATVGATGGISTYLSGPDEAIKAALEATNLEATVTLDQLDLAAAGVDVAATATALGVTPEALGKMTLPELQKTLKDTETAKFSQVSSLDAEYANATDQRKAEIDAELRRLRGSGAAEVERQMQDIGTAVEQAQTIQWMGKQVTLKELLEDDQITQDIIGAISNPALLKELKDNPSTAALGTWIETNRAALNSVVKQIQTTSGEIVGATSEVGTLIQQTFGGPAVAEAIMKSLGLDFGANYTAAELAQLQEAFANDPIAQAIADKGPAFSALQTDPSLIAQIRDLLPKDKDGKVVADADTVNGFFSGLAKVQGDEALTALLGVNKDSKFLTPDQQASLAKIEASPAWKDTELQAWIKQDLGRNKQWLDATPAQLEAARKTAQSLKANGGLGALVGFNPNDPLARADQATNAEIIKRRFPDLAKALGSMRTAGMSPEQLAGLTDLGTKLRQRQVPESKALNYVQWFNRMEEPGIKEMLGFEEGQPFTFDMSSTGYQQAKARFKAWDQIPVETKGDLEFMNLIKSGVIKGANDLQLFKDPKVWERLKPEFSIVADTKKRMAKEKTPHGKEIAAMESLFGGDVILSDIGVLADQVSNALKRGKFDSPEIKRQYLDMEKNLKDLFGFIPGRASLGIGGYPTSKEATGFFKSLTDWANLSPSELVRQINSPEGKEMRRDRSIFESIKDFMSGKKKLGKAFTEPTPAQQQQAASAPAQARGLSADQAWMKRFNSNPVVTISELPKDVAVAVVEELERSGKLEKGASQPIKDALIKTAPSSMIPESWKVRRPEDVGAKIADTWQGALTPGKVSTGKFGF